MVVLAVQGTLPVIAASDESVAILIEGTVSQGQDVSSEHFVQEEVSAGYRGGRPGRQGEGQC